MSEDSSVSVDSLRTQLVELNNRSRWYPSQQWQVPFAHLALTGVTFTATPDALPEMRPVLSFCSALLGVLVRLHLERLRDGEKRAIQNLGLVERDLKLTPAVEYHDYEGFLNSAVLAVAVLSFGWGLYLYAVWVLTICR